MKQSVNKYATSEIFVGEEQYIEMSFSEVLSKQIMKNWNSYQVWVLLIPKGIDISF